MSIRLPVLLALAATLQAGCAVYRFVSPDHPSKVALPAARALATGAEATEGGSRGERLRVAKIRGAVYGGAVGRIALSPDSINAVLSSHWPDLFDGGDDALPLTVEFGGNLPFYGSFGGRSGNFTTETALMLVLGVVRSKIDGYVTARILVENAVWSDKAKAVGTCNFSVCCQPLLFPVAYPLLQSIPPYGSDWPQDTHFGSIGYSNADRMQTIATDLAAVAAARAATALSSEQLATIRDKALLTREQLAARKRLGDGATTKSATGTAAGTIAWAETEHVFRADSSSAARGIPEIVEQRYDAKTRRGVVRADMADCDPDAAYRYLTERLIPAICETKNVVLDVDAPPPAHALFRTLKEEKEAGSDVLAIEFESLQ